MASKCILPCLIGHTFVWLGVSLSGFKCVDIVKRDNLGWGQTGPIWFPTNEYRLGYAGPRGRSGGNLNSRRGRHKSLKKAHSFMALQQLCGIIQESKPRSLRFYFVG